MIFRCSISSNHPRIAPIINKVSYRRQIGNDDTVKITKIKLLKALSEGSFSLPFSNNYSLSEQNITSEGYLPTIYTGSYFIFP